MRALISTHFLNVIIAESAAILKLLSGKDQTLLVWGNAFFILNLGLDIVDGIGRLDLEGNSLPCEGLDETVGIVSVASHQPLSGRLHLH